MGHKKPFTGEILIGTIQAGYGDPTALVIPTAEFVSPYVGLSDEEKKQMMAEVEPPTTPQVEQ